MAFAIDSDSICVGLKKANGAIAIKTHVLKHGETHTQLLIPLIEELVTNHNFKPDHLLTTCGPGRFTNVRILLATAFGLSQGYDCLLITPSCFDLVEQEYPGAVVAIMSGRGDYFCKNLQTDEEYVSADVLAHGVVTDDAEILAKDLVHATWYVEKLLKHADVFEIVDEIKAHYVKLPLFKTVEDQSKARKRPS